jgi:aryl-alcohol dehydrogenase-like predicted oxidoreductase
VVAKVPESDIGRLKVGLPASVRVDAFPDRRFQARVRQIAPRAVKTNNVTSFEVKLQLDDPAPELRIGMTAADILASCDASLKRLKTDVIDLYQIHWPERHVPIFGAMYYEPSKERSVTSIHEQLEAMSKLVKAGKVRYIGLSNETSYGVHEFVRLAEQHNLPRIAAVQNVYCLVNRILDNGLDETMHRLDVSLLAYSPLGFGLLTGKYDASGITGPDAPKEARIAKYESMRKQRWGRPEALEASRRYNALASANGMTPTQMALAFCYTNWRVASTIIGVTSVAQLDEDLNTWGTQLTPDVLAAIDAIRWDLRDPAI